jgi:hypothetical protein
MTDMFILGDLIFPAIFLVVFGLFFFRFYEELKRQQTLFEHQALKRHGRLANRGMFLYPGLEFAHENAQVMVYGEAGSKRHPARSCFVARFPLKQDCQIRIFKETAVAKAGKVLGMQDMYMNNPGFDRAFVIQGNNDLAARLFLSPPIQSKLMEWQKDNPSISISKGQLEFFVQRLLNEAGDYDRFIEAGLLFTKKLS